AILYVNLGRIGVHPSPPVRDGIKKVSRRRFRKTRLVKRGGPRKASPNNHAVSHSSKTVTYGTINVVALPPTLNFLGGNLEGKQIHELSVHPARMKQFIFFQGAARDRARHQWTCSSLIRKHIRLLIRLNSAVIVHGLAELTPGHEKNHNPEGCD